MAHNGGDTCTCVYYAHVYLYNNIMHMNVLYISRVSIIYPCKTDYRQTVYVLPEMVNLSEISGELLDSRGHKNQLQYSHAHIYYYTSYMAYRLHNAYVTIA